MVLQALCPSSNYLYTKPKSTMLWPLKGEVEMDTNYSHQNGQTPTQAPLAFIIELT